MNEKLNYDDKEQLVNNLGGMVVNELKKLRQQISKLESENDDLKQNIKSKSSNNCVVDIESYEIVVKTQDENIVNEDDNKLDENKVFNNESVEHSFVDYKINENNITDNKLNENNITDNKFYENNTDDDMIVGNDITDNKLNKNDTVVDMSDGNEITDNKLDENNTVVDMIDENNAVDDMIDEDENSCNELDKTDITDDTMDETEIIHNELQEFKNVLRRTTELFKYNIDVLNILYKTGLKNKTIKPLYVKTLFREKLNDAYIIIIENLYLNEPEKLLNEYKILNEKIIRSEREFLHVMEKNIEESYFCETTFNIRFDSLQEVKNIVTANIIQLKTSYEKMRIWFKYGINDNKYICKIEYIFSNKIFKYYEFIIEKLYYDNPYDLLEKYNKFNNYVKHLHDNFLLTFKTKLENVNLCLASNDSR